MTAAQTLLWQAAGQPPVEGAKGALLKDIPAVCAITAEDVDISADARKALGENFTDHSLWRVPSGRVGRAALWCCSGKGSSSPRMWTWVCAPDLALAESQENAPHRGAGLCLTNRANTRPVLDLLLGPPAGEWVLAVALSGQKHVLPYAATNRGDQWVIRMEDTTIRGTTEMWRTVFAHTLALRRLGVSVEHIKAGAPGPFLKTRQQIDLWAHHATALSTYAASPITDLALWTITRPILEDTDAYA